METIALDQPGFWVSVTQIIAIDILLGGDNAVVIALACRNLPPELRRRGMFWGVAGAIALRIVLTVFALSLLGVPYLKLAGAALVFWIGVKLVMPEPPAPARAIEGSQQLAHAVRTIVVADAVISFDNVVAVAAASRDSVALIVFGLLVSIPLIVWASGLVLRLVERFPVVVTLGGALIGWVALAMAVDDIAVRGWIEANARWLLHAAPVAGALAVVAVATWCRAAPR